MKLHIMRAPEIASNRSSSFSRSRKAYINGVPQAPASLSKKPSSPRKTQKTNCPWRSGWGMISSPTWPVTEGKTITDNAMRVAQRSWALPSKG